MLAQLVILVIHYYPCYPTYLQASTTAMGPWKGSTVPVTTASANMALVSMDMAGLVDIIYCKDTINNDNINMMYSNYTDNTGCVDIIYCNNTDKTGLVDFMPCYDTDNTGP